jgi:hypothetical protein
MHLTIRYIDPHLPLYRVRVRVRVRSEYNNKKMITVIKKIITTVQII